MKYISIISVLFVLNFSSCDKKHKVIRSFCYWKTDLYVDKKDDSLINEMKVKHMYIRFFDIDWNPYLKKALPVSTVRNFNAENLDVTPSIFITNTVLLQSSKLQLDSMAVHIDDRIKKVIDQYIESKAIYNTGEIIEKLYKKQKDYSRSFNFDSIREIEKNKITFDFKEILIDCDWSEKSKDNYFYLLKRLKKQFPEKKLAATIRLWQYKYATKAGIPPVDKGLLMCYNLSNIEDYNADNSIATSDELNKYLTHNKYKLPLDIALPLYSWSIIYRGKEFKGILSDYDSIINDSSIFKKKNDLRYVLKDDVLINDIFLRNGDEIHIERVSDNEINKMISIIKSKIKISDQTKITFFSFDKKYIQDYGTSNISGYYARF